MAEQDVQNVHLAMDRARSMAHTEISAVHLNAIVDYRRIRAGIIEGVLMSVAQGDGGHPSAESQAREALEEASEGKRAALASQREQLRAVVARVPEFPLAEVPE